MRLPRSMRWRLVGAGALTVIAVMSSAVTTTGAQAAELTQLPSWGNVASPTSDGFGNSFTAVYAASPDAAWAVGYSSKVVSGRPQFRPLIQRWDGDTWDQVTPPVPDSLDTTFFDVDGTGPSDVWAVGYTVEGTDRKRGHRTVTLHWDGLGWTRVPSPNLGFPDDVNQLKAVVAIAPDDVWAVGEFTGYVAGIPRTFDSILLHWDGTSWQSVAHPCGSGLDALGAAASNRVWAVGNASTCFFDGSGWRFRAPITPSGSYYLDLTDVAVFSSGEALAIGGSHDTGNSCGGMNGNRPCASFSEVQRWDGTRWNRVVNPGIVLRSMHAISANEIWATSNEGIWRFDGNAWLRVPKPDGASSDVSATGAQDIWAVGGSSIQHAPSFGTGTVVGVTNHSLTAISWVGPVSGSTEGRTRFELVELPAGTYQLIATVPRCTPQIRTVNVIAGQIVRADFTLSCG